MRSWIALVTTTAAALATACGELPPLAPLNQQVADIDIGGITCPGGGAVGAIPVGLTCTMTAQARDGNGIPIADPTLLWSSSNASILSASGSGTQGSLTGRATGAATVTVRDAANRAQATVQVQVVQRR